MSKFQIHDSFIQKLYERELLLKKVIRNRNKNLIKKHPGSLHVIPHGKGYQYYYRKTKQERSGTYIPKSKLKLAKNLAQQEYDMLLVKAAETELKALEKLKDMTEKQSVEFVYDKLNKGKQLLIAELYPSDEDYVSGFLSIQYEPKGFHSYAQEHYSLKGLRVRSKSEALIAGLLDELGIPYHYEMPLTLDNGRTVYPDFTILDMTQRQVLYLEHLGLIDDEEYRDKALRKIKAYEDSGYFLGDRLLITMESAGVPFEITQLEKRLRHLLFTDV